jgi:flagellar M-ring protein FliF
MEYFKQVFSNLGRFAKAMTPSQAILLIGIIAGSIVGVVAVGSWLGEVNYSVLYSNMDSADAGEIVAFLNDEKIPYSLTDGGRTVSVASGRVYDIRISLASQGMPRAGNVGYAIFDKSNLGMTEFLQNLNFRRALEGELMRTIMQLSGVDAARVHIVMPKDRLFKEDKRDATASIVLKLRKSGGLSKSQMAGITHLVAASVEGLQHKNISIIDQDGNLLSSENESDVLAGLTSSQLEVRKNVENYLETKAQSMLDGVVGPGRSIVRVTVDLDFQQVEKTSEVYDPNSVVIRSQQITEETGSSSEKMSEENETKDENRGETTVTNYEINKSVEHIINAIGSMNRISVAVLLDYVQKDTKGADGAVETVYEPRPQMDIDRITSIVKNAVGFDSQRSDQIEVVNISFDKKSMTQDIDKLDQIMQQEFYIDIGKKVGMVLLAIFGFLYVRKKLKRFFGSISRLLPPVKPSRAAVDSGGIGIRTAPGGEAVETEETEPLRAEQRKPTMLNRMQETAKEHPEEFAKVIKTMMVE